MAASPRPPSWAIGCTVLGAGVLGETALPWFWVGGSGDCSGWKSIGSMVRLWVMGYLAFLVISFLAATGYAKSKAVCDLDIFKGGVKA